MIPRPADDPRFAEWDRGLPAGTIALAVTLLQDALAPLGSGYAVDPVRVAQWMWLPWYLGVEPPPAPVELGGRLLCVDLGPGDAEVWATFQGTLRGDEDAPAIAAAAQDWRISVTPYLPMEDSGGPFSAPPTRTEPVARRDALRGLTVLDLTVAWGGPLATVLFGALGATVVKVEPVSRPDGFRFALGYPDQSPWFVALNRGKTRAPLDLDHAADRSEFAERAAEAHIVVDNMSPRARANLQLDELVGSTPWLSVSAFSPSAPQHRWVSYGTGVHAMSGLAHCADGSFRPPAVAYPDVLTGLSAFGHGLVLATSYAAGGASARVELSMAEAVRPLVAGHDGGRSLAAAPAPPPAPSDPAHLPWPFDGADVASPDTAAP